MVNRVTTPEALMDEALQLAEKFAAVPPPRHGGHQAALLPRASTCRSPQALEEGRDDQQAHARVPSIDPMKPLEHVTILDLSRVLACPFASMILAELGATVIKIEEPARGDETRSFEPFVEKNGAAESAYYFACNRGKQSVTVNLRSPDGQAIVRDLARQADVFLENFPVGTLKRYGLDYPAIRAVNERIVYVSCTGFGQSGPYAQRKGYDTIFQAMGGIMSLTGERGGRAGEARPAGRRSDLGPVGRDRDPGRRCRDATPTGQGCHIDFSMLDGQIALLTLAAARYFALGEVPPRLGTEHPGRVPSASFVCADGGYLHITASDQHWLPLCKALGP